MDFRAASGISPTARSTMLDTDHGAVDLIAQVLPLFSVT